jgi:hypothetical protein
MKLTLPQVMMLNHAAWVEHENADIRYQHKKKQDAKKEQQAEADPIVGEFGCALSELDGNTLNAYLGDWSGFGS